MRSHHPLKSYWRKQDWRTVNVARHEPHLAIRWFHWSWRPRVVWCYWDDRMHEQRVVAVKWGKL